MHPIALRIVAYSLENAGVNPNNSLGDFFDNSRKINEIANLFRLSPAVSVS